MSIQDDPLFHYCIQVAEKHNDLEHGWTSPDVMMPLLKQRSDTEQPPDEVGIAIVGNQIIISGDDYRLIEDLQALGITPVRIRTDICG
jgi:hypothetical protein